MQPSIIILHGWELETDKYQKLKQKLEVIGYKVYLPTLPMDKIYTLFDYQEFLLNFIKKNNIVKPILLGHSFGGRISLLTASNNPDKFSKLILTGVPGYNPVPSFKIKLFYVLAKTGKLLFIIPPLSLFDKLARKILYFLSGSFDYYKSEGNIRKTFQNIIKLDLDKYIKTISIPTLLIWGENDKITPVWIAKKMNQNIKNSQLIIVKNEKHNLLFNNPDVLIKTIRNSI